MFRINRLCSLACSIVLLSLPMMAGAQSIVSTDGVREFDERGAARESGGETLFTFRWHPESPNDPEGFLFGTQPDVVTLDPVELFQQYSDREIVEAPGYRALIDQSLAGGVASSFSDMVLEEFAVLQRNCIAGGAPVAGTEIRPVFSDLRIETNPIRGNATLVVFSYKEIVCDRNEDGNIDADERIPLKRRWVVAVIGGLEEGPISKQIGGREFTYKLFAEGRSIQLLSYYSNLTLTGKRWQNDMQLIHGYDQFGNVDPRNRYYERNARSCVDIDFLTPPPNGQAIWSVHPSDVRFCARGCIPGDIDATK